MREGINIETRLSSDPENTYRVLVMPDIPSKGDTLDLLTAGVNVKYTVSAVRWENTHDNSIEVVPVLIIKVALIYKNF